jgi:hypothetical protein
MNRTNDPQVRAARINARAVIVAAIITAILAPIIVYAFIHNPTPSTGPTPTIGRSAGLTPTPPSSTVPPNTLTNRHLVCTSNCDIAVIKITVVSFTLDPTQNQTSMLLLLNSQRNHSNCSLGQSQSPNTYIIFEDSTGKMYEARGPAVSSFSLVAGQPLQLTAIFSFLPSPGSIYTLKSLAVWGEDFITDAPTYGDAQFQFE